MGALKNQAVGYNDEAAQYGFTDFESYKKANRGGLKAGMQYGTTMAGTGAGIGSAFGPIGTAIGAGAGALVGGTYGGITGNRKMKRDYLNYAQAMTEQAQLKEQQEADALAAADLSARAKSERDRLQREQLMGLDYQGMQYMKKGGLNQYTTINIEKGELLVNPKTLEIVDNYNDAPKHPDGKHEVDLRGNREVPVGYAVIPAKMAEDFKKASPEQRKEMINKLPGFSGNPKLDGGTKDLTPMTRTTMGDIGLQPYTNQATIYDPNAPLVYNNPNDLFAMYNKSYGDMPTEATAEAEADASGNKSGWGAVAAYAPAAAMGAYQMYQSNRGLKQLEKEPYARYNEEVQPENAQSLRAAQARALQAQARARYGLDPAQRAVYDQQIARDMNTRMRASQDIAGGNASQAIGGILNANRIQAAQQIAAQDVQAMQQKQRQAEQAAQYAEGIANRIAAMRMQQQNANVGFDQRLRLMKEQAYGQAKSQGMQNIVNAASGYAASQYNPYVKQV